MMADPAPAPSPPAPAPAPAPQIMGKYADQNALVEAHKSAESTIGTQNQQIADLKAQIAKAAAPPAETPGGVTIPDKGEPAPATHIPMGLSIDRLLSEAKQDPKVLAEQWMGSGSLTDEQYAALTTKVDRPTIDQYFQGQQAIVELGQRKQVEIKQSCIQICGSQQQLDTLMQHSKGFEDVRKDNLNERLANPQLYAGAMAEIIDDYNRSNGLEKSKQIIIGQPASTTGPTGNAFTSRRELVEATKKARAAHGGRHSDEFKDAEFAARVTATEISKLI